MTGQRIDEACLVKMELFFHKTTDFHMQIIADAEVLALTYKLIGMKHTTCTVHQGPSGFWVLGSSTIGRKAAFKLSLPRHDL